MEALSAQFFENQLEPEPYQLGRATFQTVEPVSDGNEADNLVGAELFAQRRAQVRADEIILGLQFSESSEELFQSQLVGLNPIGSALNYYIYAQEYGESNERTKEALEYVKNDARTQIFEMLIARGHISQTESHWDEDEQSFSAAGTSLLSVLVNSLQDSRLCDAEYGRREAELREELFVEEAFKAGLFEDNILLTISPFPDDMSEEEAGNMGYKPDTRKYMMRWVEIDSADVRTTKQISISGSDTRVISDFMRLHGFIDGTKDLTSTQILSKQMLFKKDEFKNVAHVAKEIDDLTEGEVFLGGEQNGDTYETLESASQFREQKLQIEVDRFAAAIIDIARQSFNGEISIDEANEMYLEKAQETIIAIATEDPQIGREALGDEASDKFELARQFVSLGDFENAWLAQQAAADTMNRLYACGVGVGLMQESGVASNNSDGNNENCVTLSDGELVRCPSCHQTVHVIVRGGKYYCPNQACKLAKSDAGSNG